MAFLQSLSGPNAAGEPAQAAWKLPVGMTSPLWVMFGAAASAGVAYWWMTQWTRAVNVEALSALAPVTAPPKPHAPAEIIAEPAPASEPAADAASQTAPVAEAPAAPAALEAAADDDLTRMVGIGPKLAAALAARGVTRFADIAAWTGADLAEIDAALSLKGRATREAWVEQARRLTADA